MPRLPFDTLQKLDLPLTEMVSSRLSFVHDCFLPFPYEVRSSLPRGDRDLIVLLGRQGWEERMRELGEHPGRVVLVFAQGDAPIRNPPGRRGLPPNVIAAYTTNNELADRRAVAVPLGVRINNLRALQFVRQNSSAAKTGLLYGNFALNERYYRPKPSGTPHVRRQLVDRLREEPWAHLDISDDHRLDPEDQLRFYSQAAAHKFVLSPEGRGIDCYRTWESLYLGSIPIVAASPAMSAFADLPILFTEDYSELSQAYLEQRWEEMSRRSFETERLLSTYYSRHFLDSVGTLDDPRFVCWKVDDYLSDAFVLALRRSSLLAGSIVAETPRPPFVDSPDLMVGDAWHTPGALRLGEAEKGLRIFVEEGGHARAELPLKTIAGAPFRLTGELRQETGVVAPLSIDIVDGREVFAAACAGNGHGPRVELDFVARSDRTVLSIRAPEPAAGTTWLVRDLSVDTTV